MEVDKARRAACDRCRGQKLRCVGLANPIHDPNSRFQRNEKPCDRCKKAKVECYSVRPAPRKSAASEGSRMKSFTDQQVSVEQSPKIVSSLNTADTLTATTQATLVSRPVSEEATGEVLSRHRSPAAGQADEQSYQLPSELDALPTVPPMPNEWMSFIQNDNMDWNNLGLVTPESMLDSELNIHRETVLDSAGDQDMIDLTDKTPCGEWSSSRLAIDTDFNLTEAMNGAASRPSAQFSNCDSTYSSHEVMKANQTLGYNSKAAKICVQELAKLNEVLLREKTSNEDLSLRQTFETGQRSIGQTLHHCQEFISILRRLKSLCAQPSDEKTSGNNNWAAPSINENGNNTKHSRSLARQSKTAITMPVPSHPALEVSTLLSILSCYTYILQSYDLLFTSILDALTRSTPEIPATLTGIRLDGFELDGHNILQLECLINVSFNMLERIENILIGNSGQGGLFSPTRSDFLGDKLFVGLLDALYDRDTQSGLAYGHDRREVRAKRLIRQIQAALKVIDF